MFIDYVKFIDKVEAPDDTTRRVHLLQAQGEHARAVDPHPARAHLEQGHAHGGREQVQEPAAHHRLRPLPDRGVEEGRVRAHGRQQGLLARRPQGRRGHLPDLPEPGHDGAGPQDRRHPERLEHPLGAVRRAEQRARPRGDPRRRRSASTNSASTAPTRRSTPSRPATRCCRTRPSAAPSSGPIDKDKIVSIGYSGNAAPADTLCTADFYAAEADYHLTPPTTRTPSTSTRRGRRSTRPAIPTATATASASTRASPSSCASTPAPSHPRARTAASSSPAGSRRSAWTSTTRSSTTAPSATSSTTTTATSTPPTSTCSSGAGAATSTPTSSCPS